MAVSKYQSTDAIRQAWAAGQRDFGENRPQELYSKVRELSDLDGIRWHFLGHLQTNKLKMVLPYATLVQSVDSRHLLDEIQKWAAAAGKRIDVLLEMHIGAEETKQGFHEEDILDILFDAAKFPNVRFCGLMGMASHSTEPDIIHGDFERISDYFDYLADLFPELPDFKELSIGMSGDWEIALEHKATIVRIGTSIFGERQI